MSFKIISLGSLLEVSIIGEETKEDEEEEEEGEEPISVSLETISFVGVVGWGVSEEDNFTCKG
jgi:hypothetical protein